MSAEKSENSLDSKRPFTKQNLDICLKELAKEFRKLNGKNMTAEITLIGGASVLINYGFREMTYDIDAIINSSSAMKDAIISVGDKMGLPVGWINTDFMNTASYSKRLIQYSKYYKTFSNIMQVRTISAEYLVAMKMMSGRQYKNDLSDIVGIIVEQKNMGRPIVIEDIKRAVNELYGNYECIPETSWTFLKALYDQKDLEGFFKKCRETELKNKDVLVQFESDYPGVLNSDNLEDILKAAEEKKKQLF